MRLLTVCPRLRGSGPSQSAALTGLQMVKVMVKGGHMANVLMDTSRILPYCNSHVNNKTSNEVDCYRLGKA